MPLSKEWILAIAICSLPFLLFGAAEIAGLLRRRRREAIARRPKSLPGRKGSSPKRLREPARSAGVSAE